MGDHEFRLTGSVKGNGVIDYDTITGESRFGVGGELSLTSLVKSSTDLSWDKFDFGLRGDYGIYYTHFFGENPSNKFGLKGTVAMMRWLAVSSGLYFEIGKSKGGSGNGYCGIGENFYSACGGSGEKTFWKLGIINLGLVLEPFGTNLGHIGFYISPEVTLGIGSKENLGFLFDASLTSGIRGTF